MQFTDSIPTDYDTYLGPFIFDYYAADLAARLSIPAGGRLLETACGTGISTEHLHRRLGPEVSIVATDVSAAMLGRARARRGGLTGVRFEEVDATDLGFEDGSFDAVASQFGLMFMPDKLRALRESHRVLRPGGRIVFSVWDTLASNPYVDVAQDAIATFFDANPPQFLYLPWSYHDRGVLRGLLEEAGFHGIELHTVPYVCERPDARDVAIGLVRGNPTLKDVQERARQPVEDVVDAVAEALRGAFGDAPLRAPMQAVVATAER